MNLEVDLLCSARNSISQPFHMSAPFPKMGKRTKFPVTSVVIPCFT